jgi:methyl-accepting chemotaxis protein
MIDSSVVELRPEANLPNPALRNLQERRVLVRGIAMLMLPAGLLSSLLYAILLVVGRFEVLPVFALSLWALCFASITIYLTKSSSTAAQIRKGSIVLMGGVSICVMGGSFLYSFDSDLAAFFFVLIIVAGIISTSLAQFAIYSAINFVALISSWLFQKVIVLYSPPVLFAGIAGMEIFPWALCFIVAVLAIVVFMRRLNRSTQELESQSETLRQLVAKLQASNDFGSQLSNDLVEVTNNLSSASKEQASNTQEQVAAVMQVTNSLEELSETAGQIAQAAQSAAQATHTSLTVAGQVSAASYTARDVAQEGTSAVEGAVNSVEQLRNRIELLGQRLLNLTEQTRRVGNIIDIIDEIAGETHLLALNASIEAAGASGGELSATFRAIQGERFGVIAQEIKNLSDRSREATEEVRQAISEMQGAVAAAVLVAEEGKKETVQAVTRSQIAGTVITRLNTVIRDSAKGANQILESIREVSVRCEEISLATGQQRSANQQILATMRSVAEVARLSASTVMQLSETATRVNSRVDELNIVLLGSQMEQPVTA